MSYDPNTHRQQPSQPGHGQVPPPARPYTPPQQQVPYVQPGRPLPSGRQPGGWVPPPPAEKKNPLVIIAIICAAVLGVCLFGAAVNNFDDQDDAASVTGPTGGTSARQADEKDAGDDADGMFNVPVGFTITAKSGGDVVEATLRSVKSYKEACNSLDVDPDNGLFVVLDVLVVQRKGDGSVNPLDFTFVADDGTSNNALSSIFSGCDEPQLDSADLRAGQKRAGKIAFDVNSETGTLEWAPGGFGAKTVGSWQTK